MVIDCHIHLYPTIVHSNPTSWAVERNEAYWLSCALPPSGKTLQSWKTVDELVADMDRDGVEKVVALSWYWENHDTCVENVSWLIEAIARYPERIVAFAPFNPQGKSKAIELLKIAYDSGFKGLGELNPPAQAYDYQDPTLAEALALTAEYGLAANFHVTDPTTHTYPGKIETAYLSLLELANEHPKTQFVLAHLGGCEPMRCEKPIPPNVYFDTAAFPLLYKTPMYREFCDKVGVDKLLFGTDYPLRVFPKSKDSPDFKSPLTQLRNCGFTDAEVLKITRENAVRLFNLS